jgi:hypothetical protein
MSRAEEQRPVIGVLLDGTPLPELLTKHLGLEPGQGLRIMNVNAGSPADKAGLERDDIIIAFQGRKVTDSQQVIDAVAKAGMDAEVSMDVIHLGQRKTVAFKLEPGGKVEWKYPSEPDTETSWRPGKVFKIGPDGQKWMEIPFEKLPDFDLDIERFFKEMYRYEYTVNGESYTVTVEGDPADGDTQVIVRAGSTEHETTVSHLESLPEKYRESAKEAVQNARKSAKNTRVTRRFRLPSPPRPDAYRKLFDALSQADMDRLAERKDRALERLQEQMDRLQQRMEQLEDRWGEALDKLLNGSDKVEEEPGQTGESAPSPSQGEKRV